MRIIMLGVAFLALACSSNLTMADNESKEPAVLTQARKTYNAQVNAALDPIKKKHLAQLEELKKKLGGKGDLEGATAVQKEIVFIKSISAGDAGDKVENNDVPENLIVDLKSRKLTYSANAPSDLLKNDKYKTDKLVMRRISAGEFMMGEIINSRKVTLTKDFYIGVFEVTQGQWEKVMKTTPPGTNNVKKDAPAEQVSWDDCQNFIKKLSGKKSSDLEFRLPTEAEWEYACRGSNISKGFEYSGSNNLDEVGWFESNSVDSRHPVGKKKPNELGLYDMSGNVWEWCSDWLGDYPKEAEKDPQGAKSGSKRVIRGGCYSGAACCRSATRESFAPAARSCALGVRLCLGAPLALPAAK